MSVPSAIGRYFIFFCAAIFLAGCWPPRKDDGDERKNSHFVTGISRKNGMDYKGAIQAFEKALEDNPRSASAHLELGLLYEQKMEDHASAIYHYQKHVDLRPNSNVAQMVLERIMSCKVELAKTVPFALVSQQVQASLEKLSAENNSLRQQVEQLKTQLAQQTPTLTNRLLASAHFPASNAVATEIQRPALIPGKTSVATPVSVPLRPAASVRRYIVQKNETFASIARGKGIPLERLLAANPGVEPKQLKVGQAINIPAP